MTRRLRASPLAVAASPWAALAGLRARRRAYSVASIVGDGLIIAAPPMTGVVPAGVRSHTRPVPPPAPPPLC